MENWEEKLAELDPRLADWYERFDAAFRKAAKKKGGLFRKPTPEQLDEAEREARASVGEELLTEAAALLDQVCGRFLEALPGERARIRAHVGHHQSVARFFWTYLQSWPESIENDATLKLALAAAAVHDLRSDIESVDELLARIWLQAAEHELDARAAFREVAQVANRATGGGSSHFRERLLSFESSVAFREHVQPHLKGRPRAKAS